MDTAAAHFFTGRKFGRKLVVSFVIDGRKSPWLTRYYFTLMVTIKKALAPKEKITITKKPTIQKPAATKNKITVKWKHFKHTSKKTKAIWKKIKKVQVQCATDSSFKNIVKTTTVGKGKTKATIKGLQKKTTYYVRVRYYDGAGYSAWSKAKKIKTKK